MSTLSRNPLTGCSGRIAYPEPDQRLQPVAVESRLGLGIGGPTRVAWTRRYCRLMGGVAWLLDFMIILQSKGCDYNYTLIPTVLGHHGNLSDVFVDATKNLVKGRRRPVVA